MLSILLNPILVKHFGDGITQISANRSSLNETLMSSPWLVLRLFYRSTVYNFYHMICNRQIRLSAKKVSNVSCFGIYLDIEGNLLYFNG